MTLKYSEENLLQMADHAFAESNFTLAGELYHRVLAAAPHNPPALRGLGMVAEAVGDLATATDYINATIAAIDPSVRHAIRIDLARVQLKQGMLDDAMASLMAAGEVFENAHRIDEAIYCYRQVRGLVPNDPVAGGKLAAMLCNKAELIFYEDGENARSLIEEAAELVPGNSTILQVMARTYAYHGPEAKRQATLDQMIAEFDRVAPPAPAPRGLLEVDPALTSAQEIASSLLSDGAVLVRGLLTLEGQAHFLALAEQRWVRDEALIFPHIPTVVHDAMAIIFGRAPKGMVSASNVRTARIEDDQSYLFYHQDLTPLCIMGINLWAALDPIDGTRPGLEVLVRRQHRTFPVTPGHIVDSSPYRIPDELVRGVYPDSDFAAPRMDVGDGMLFLFTTVHRSHLTPEMTQSRRNAELRFI